MAETAVTIVGNLTDAPDLRFTPNGVAVADFTVAVNPRVRKGDEWVDGEPSFFRCQAWRQLGENVTESLSKGNRVIVTGTLKQESWEGEDGSRRSMVRIEATEVGPSLKWAVAKPHRASPSEASSDQGNGARKGRRQTRSASSTSRRSQETRARSGGDFDEEPDF